jgi:hypothetical protein
VQNSVSTEGIVRVARLIVALISRRLLSLSYKNGCECIKEGCSIQCSQNLSVSKFISDDVCCYVLFRLKTCSSRLSLFYVRFLYVENDPNKDKGTK